MSRAELVVCFLVVSVPKVLPIPVTIYQSVRLDTWKTSFYLFLLNLSRYQVCYLRQVVHLSSTLWLLHPRPPIHLLQPLRGPTLNLPISCIPPSYPHVIFSVFQVSPFSCCTFFFWTISSSFQSTEWPCLHSRQSGISVASSPLLGIFIYPVIASCYCLLCYLYYYKITNFPPPTSWNLCLFL